MGQVQETSRNDLQPGIYDSRPLSMGYLSILVHDNRMIKLQKTQQKIRNAKHRQPPHRKQDRLFKRCYRSQEARRVGAGQWEDTQGTGLGEQGSLPPPGSPHSAAVSSYRKSGYLHAASDWVVR